jgi:hypothetical protein
MWNRNSIIGFSDTETVKLDFDNTPFKNVKYWAERAMNWHKLGGFIILKSSENCYHVLFNRSVSWSENTRIVAWVALQARNQGLTGWFIMECIKESSTLRISPKRNKPPPRIVFRLGKQDQQLKIFVRNRHLIKEFIKKM